MSILKYQVSAGCPIDRPIKPPHYEGDVGYDLGVAIREERMTIMPHAFHDIPSYIRIELPKGYWGDIRPRSSTFAKRRLLVMPSTIDNGYRGNISIFIFNPNPDPVTIHRGDYLAQLVIMPIVTPQLRRVEHISDSERGDKGFGSSGGYKPDAADGQSHIEATVTGWKLGCVCQAGPNGYMDCPVGKAVGNHYPGDMIDQDGTYYPSRPQIPHELDPIF